MPRRVRDAAYRRAYVTVIAGTLAAVLGLQIGVGDAVGARHLEALFVTFALVGVLTPPAVIAWTQPEV